MQLVQMVSPLFYPLALRINQKEVLQRKRYEKKFTRSYTSAMIVHDLAKTLEFVNKQFGWLLASSTGSLAILSQLEPVISHLDAGYKCSAKTIAERNIRCKWLARRQYPSVCLRREKSKNCQMYRKHHVIIRRSPAG